MDILESSSFYQKIQQTMQIQEISRKIQGTPNTLDFLGIS